MDQARHLGYAHAGHDEPLRLASDGHSKYTVVISKGADQVERFAAQELQRYLELIAEVHLEIVNLEDKTLALDWKADAIIVIGRNKLSERFVEEAGLAKESDSILIRTFHQALLLVGSNSRSTLFAVYDLLERIGCAWIRPGPHGERVPRLRTLDLPAQNITHTASLVRRNVFVTDELPTLQDIDWMAKHKLNHFEAYLTYRFDIWETLKDGLIQELTKRGMSIEITDHSHSFWVSPARFAKDHPEYFALVDGERLIDRRNRPYGEDPPHLCVSNAEVKRIVAGGMITYLKANPEVETLGLWPNDNVDFCQCEACVAMDGPRHMYARRELLFNNRVSELVSKELPNRAIATLVTSAWKAEEVPTDVRPASNLFLWFAPINACYRHSIADTTCSVNKSVREYLEGWLRIFPPNRVGILEFYDADWGARFAHPGYEPMTQRLSADMKYYARVGIAGIYAWPGMGHSILGFRGQHELTMNTFAQLAWDADGDLWEIVSHYSKGKYGGAWKAMVEVYREIDKTTSGETCHAANYNAREGTSHTGRYPAELFAPEVWARLKPHFEQAFFDASSDADARSAVEQFEAQIRSSRLVYEMSRPVVKP